MNFKKNSVIYYFLLIVFLVTFIVVAGTKSEEEYIIKLDAEKQIITKINIKEDKSTRKFDMIKEIRDNINNYVDDSNGFLIDIWSNKTNDYSSVRVVVSNDWHDATEQEKKIFCGIIAGDLKKLINCKKVYFVDVLDVEIAKPGITGGYNIKR